MERRPRRSFTQESRLRRSRWCGCPAAAYRKICRDLDLTETAVRRLVEQAEIDAGRRGI
jgi:transposase-like protein